MILSIITIIIHQCRSFNHHLHRLGLFFLLAEPMLEPFVYINSYLLIDLPSVSLSTTTLDKRGINKKDAHCEVFFFQ